MNPTNSIKSINVSHTGSFSSSGRFGIAVFLLLLQPLLGHVASAQCNIGGTVNNIGSVPYTATGLTTCGAGDNLTGANTITCGSSSYLQSEDVTFIFTVPADDLYHVTLTNASQNQVGLKLYDGCPLTGGGGTCVGNVGNFDADKILAANLVSGNTYYLVIDRNGTACFTYDLKIDVPDQCPAPGSTGWTSITIPYNSTGETTCGKGDDLRYYNTVICGSSNYLAGEDQVYIFTSSSTALYHFTLTNTSQSNVGMKLYDGCPMPNQGGSCIASVANFDADKILAANLVFGNTYYLVIDRNSASCFTYDLKIEVPDECPTGTTTGWTFIPSIPFSATGETNCASGDDLMYFNTITCGSSGYFAGEDHVYVFTAPTTDLYNISLTNTSSTGTGLKLYNGCPLLSQGGSCVTSMLSSTGDKIMPANLVMGTTYYLVVDNQPGGCYQYDISVSVPLSCPAADTTGWTYVSGFPVYLNDQSTCGNGNQITSVNSLVCGSSGYLASEDHTFVFTPTFTDSFYVRIENASENSTGIKVYAGCPFIGTGGSCSDHLLNSSADKSLRTWLQAGTEYFIVIDRSVSDCFDFNFIIDTVPQCPVASPVVNAPAPVCPGTAMPNLQVNNPIGNVTWYADEMLDSVLHLGTSYTPGAFTQTVWVTNTSFCESTPTSVVVQVLSNPAIVMLDDDGIHITEKQVRFATAIQQVSSQDTAAGSGASAVLGTPDVYPQYGDVAGGWKPAGAGRQFIELSFPEPNVASAIVIYETYHPGGVDTIYGYNPNSLKWEILWSATATSTGSTARIFQADFPETSYELSKVRIALDADALPGPFRIDAVGLMNPLRLACEGDSITLRVNETGTYNWSTGANTQSIKVAPQDTTSYSVTVTTAQCVYSSSVTVNVVDQTPPGMVSNMLPVNNALNVNVPVTFSWQPATGATDYDLYVWPDTTAPPATPVKSAVPGLQTTVGIPSVMPGATFNWQLVANNFVCVSTPGSVQTFTTRYMPDLVVSNLQVDTAAYTGQPLLVSLEVTNIGNGSTDADGWRDALFLSLDTVLDLQNDVLLGAWANQSYLLPGASYTRTLSVGIPQNILGGFYLIAAANYDCKKKIDLTGANITNKCKNPLDELTLENNLSVSSSSIQFTLPPLPDLEATGFAAPATSFAGDSIIVQYSVQNTGNDVANSSLSQLIRDMCEWITPSIGGKGVLVISEPRIFCALYEPFWVDRVYWSHDSIFDPFDDTVIFETRTAFVKERFESAGNVVPGWYEVITLPEREHRFNTWYSTPSYLDINDSYGAQHKVELPACEQGTYYLHFVTDVFGLVWEQDMANNVLTRTIEVLPTPPPDLQIDSIEVPSPVFSGTDVTVKYKTVNAGAGPPAFNFWYDRLYLSSSPVLDTATATHLRRKPISHGDTIMPGGSQWYQTPVRIPQGLSGTHYLHIWADAEDRICEFDDQNNTGTLAIQVTLTPPPDLEVTQVVLPAIIYAESQVQLEYTVSNSGTGMANGPWVDSIFISSSATFDTTAVFLRRLQITDTLDAAQAYSRTLTISLPNMMPGTYYLYVMTDAADNVYEHNSEGNNLYQHGPFQVLPRIASDLAVSAFSVTGTPMSGEQLSYSFTVQNIGAGPTNAPRWADRIYISPQPTITGDTIPIHTRSRLEPLADGEQYTFTGQLRIPDGASGSLYLLLVADAFLLVDNDTVRSNNVFSVPVTVTLWPSPDLTLVSIQIPSTFFAGVSMPISYTVQNQGTGVTKYSWADRIGYDIEPSVNHSKSITYRMHEMTLTPGGQYTDTAWVRMPSFTYGNYYLILSLDHGDHLYEHNGETNNITFHPIFVEQPEPADLVVSAMTMPDTAYPGRPAKVEYQVVNVGANAAAGVFYNNAYVHSANLPGGASQSFWGYNRADDYQLGPGDTAEFVLRQPVPVMREGFFKTEVNANVTQSLNETDLTNNSTLSPDSTVAIIPVLPLGQDVVDTLLKAGKNFYRLNLPADADLRVTVTNPFGSVYNGIFLRHLDVPDGPNYHRRNGEGNVPNPVLLVPGTQAGVNYLLVQNFNTGQFSFDLPIVIRADLLPFGIDSITPNVMGQGRVTSIIYGAGFRDGLDVELVDALGQVAATGNVLQFRNSMELQVRWQLELVPVGVYDVRITNPGGGQATLVNGVTVEPAKPFDVSLTPRYSRVIGARSPATYGFVYRNEGNVDVPYLMGAFAYNSQSRLIGLTKHPRIHTRSGLLSSILDIAKDDVPDFQAQPDSGAEQNIISAIIRDFAPGEEIGFSMVFRNFPYAVFTITPSMQLLTSEEYMTIIAYSALNMRDYIQQNSDFEDIMEVSAMQKIELHQYLADSSAFMHSIYQMFIDAGLLSPEDTAGFEYNCDGCLSLSGGSNHVQMQGDNSMGERSSGIEVSGGSGGPASMRGFDIPPPPGGCDSWGQALGSAYCEALADLSCPAGAACLILSPFIIEGLAAVAATGVGSVAAAQGAVTAFLLCKGLIVGCVITLTTGGPTSLEEVVCSQVVKPCDPNEIQGPFGYGDEQFISVNDTVHYMISFENDPDFASAPALGVRIEVPISNHANPLSARLGNFGFGNYVFEVPDNTAAYQERIDLTDSMGIYLDVIAGLDITRNMVFWHFESVDPFTGIPPEDPFKGFLLVNDSTGQGEGFANFQIRPDPASQTGDTLAHFADIYFDLNPPVTTNTHFNTIDAYPPTTQVQSLPAISEDSMVTVSLSGADDPGGSGLESIRLYVSVNGDPFTVMADGRDTVFTYDGAPCELVSFYSSGVDNVRNREPKSSADAHTIVARSDVSAGDDELICLGETTTLTAAAGASYAWSNGATTQSITVTPITTTSYAVTVTDAQGCPGMATVTVTVEDCSGISELNGGLLMTIYPNVVSDEFEVQIDNVETGDYVLVVTDNVGRAVFERGIALGTRSHKELISARTWAAGLYFVELKREATVAVGRVVVQK